MEKTNRIPYNLQFFNDDGGAGTGGGGEGGSDGNENAGGGKGAENQPKTPTFAELLKTDKAFASDLDKHVAKATTTAVATARTKWEEEQKLSEAELAKKRQTEQDQQLKDREAALATRELRADMVTEIGKRGLPAALIDAISLTDKDVAATSLDAIETAYRGAVDAGIAEKLKGSVPKDTGGGGGDSFLKSLRAAAGLKETGK